jgi:hypothetical protein
MDILVKIALIHVQGQKVCHVLAMVPVGLTTIMRFFVNATCIILAMIVHWRALAIRHSRALVLATVYVVK